MAGFAKTDGLILREVKYKEADRLLTVFTPNDGIVTMKAPGALRKNSKIGAGTQQLIYSELTTFNRNGFINITEAEIKEGFGGLRNDFTLYALGCYFSECVESLCPADTPDKDTLQLILNSLYALSNSLYDYRLIKAAFELRLMAISGYAPDLDECMYCGKIEPERPTIGFETGRIACRDCRGAEIGRTDYLCSESLRAMRYIVSAPAKKLFSFEISEDALRRLADACEDYIIAHSGRYFGTLDYWKKIKL